MQLYGCRKGYGYVYVHVPVKLSNYEFANFWQNERTGATGGRGRTWARTGTSISITWKPVIQPAETFSLLSGIHPERAA